MGRGSGNRKEWQQKNKEDKAAAEAEAAAAEAETKGLGTLNFREFRAALRELGRDKGLYLFENETKKLFDEVAALQAELRSLLCLSACASIYTACSRI